MYQNREKKCSHTLPLAVIALLLFFSLLSGQGHTQTILELQPGFYCAGIPSSDFELLAAPETAGKQRQSNWCWAASIQMILNFHGVEITQEDIVSYVFGDLVDSPATSDTVLATLSGWEISSNGQNAKVTASPYVERGTDIIADLAYQQPLIVGLQTPEGIGHACVLTAVSYILDSYTNMPILQGVVIRDPWPTRQSRIEMSWDEFYRRLMFIARVRVEKDS